MGFAARPVGRCSRPSPLPHRITNMIKPPVRRRGSVSSVGDLCSGAPTPWNLPRLSGSTRGPSSALSRWAPAPFYHSARPGPPRYPWPRTWGQTASPGSQTARMVEAIRPGFPGRKSMATKATPDHLYPAGIPWAESTLTTFLQAETGPKHTRFRSESGGSGPQEPPPTQIRPAQLMPSSEPGSFSPRPRTAMTARGNTAGARSAPRPKGAREATATQTSCGRSPRLEGISTTPSRYEGRNTTWHANTHIHTLHKRANFATNGIARAKSWMGALAPPHTSPQPSCVGHLPRFQPTTFG